MQIRDKFCLELTGKSIRTILNLSEGVDMIERNKLIEPEKVSCEVCLKEIPISEASSVKATDYIMYYCGLECYEKWKKQAEKSGKESVSKGNG